MAEFKKLVITKKGQEAMNDSLLTSNFLTFNKISSSLHIYSDEEISDLTKLDDIKQTVDISRVSKINEETIQVETVINNTELKEGYALNSLGVYVNYKDEDILYGVASVESVEKSSYIPPFNEKVPTAASIKLLIALSDTSTIHFSIDPTGQATIGDILDLQNNINEVEKKIPTTTSKLKNDSNYVVDESYVHTDNNYSNEEKQKLENLSNNILKYFVTTLAVESWQLNEETYYYEYDVVKEGITSNTLVNGTLDIPNQEKFTGDISIESYDGGFKIITNELPTEEIEICINYQLVKAEMEVEV